MLFFFNLKWVLIISSKPGKRISREIKYEKHEIWENYRTQDHMNFKEFTGKCNQIAGWLEEMWYYLSGNRQENKLREMKNEE